MTEAKYYNKLGNNNVHCVLCPHNCKLASGKYGLCKARVNHNGVLFAETYGKISSKNLDPIEKKPLYHFLPGSKIFSIGSLGCNFKCYFCQNHEISQCGINDYPYIEAFTPEQIVNQAKKYPDNIGIAFTYNEPFIGFEYMLETAKLAKKTGLKNVVVSNGYINTEPLAELIPEIDAFNIDLKAFTNKFYQQKAAARLQPVLQTLQQIKKAGKHLEITHLVITDENDDINDFKDLVSWILQEFGKDTILHISRYFPRYKSTASATSASTLEEFLNYAKTKLSNVYLGNI